MSSYVDFLKSKEIVDRRTGIEINLDRLNKRMRMDQSLVTRWLLARGCAGDYKDTGLGKTFDLLEWSRIVHEETNKKVLILSPIAVAQQHRREGLKFGIDVTVCKDQDDVKGGINITNYQRLHKFNKHEFVAVAADEASSFKDHSSATFSDICEFVKGIPFRLALSATPAPNSHCELGCQAEFLGIMSQGEMRATWFEHDGKDTSQYHLKPWGRESFWKWLASWCVYIRKPSDIGCPNTGFDLPPLKYHKHIIRTAPASAGFLFAMPAKNLSDQRAVKRATIDERCANAADLVNASNNSVVTWCELNDEGDMLADAIKDSVQVSGADSIDRKEEILVAFTEGRIGRLITKPSICSQGLNWQHVSEQHFVNVSHSAEKQYQAVRRSYRFGQESQVDVHLHMSEQEMPILENVERKQAESDLMASEMVKYMTNAMKENMMCAKHETENYTPTERIKIPSWLKTASV